VRAGERDRGGYPWITRPGRSGTNDKRRGAYATTGEVFQSVQSPVRERTIPLQRWVRRETDAFTGFSIRPVWLPAKPVALCLRSARPVARIPDRESADPRRRTGIAQVDDPSMRVRDGCRGMRLRHDRHSFDPKLHHTATIRRGWRTTAAAPRAPRSPPAPSLRAAGARRPPPAPGRPGRRCPAGHRHRR
jgi:hypothetical protein